MEDELLDPNKEERARIRGIFSHFAETGQAPTGQGEIEQAPVITDPNVNPFPDVPLPAGFRETPLPPIQREPAVGDMTSDIEEELDRHEQEAR